MKKIKLGLISKIAILIGIIELIAFSLLSYLYAEKYASDIENNIRNRIHQINKMIANEEIPISSLSRNSFMSSMIGELYLEGVVIGSNGIIIVSSKPEYLGRKPDTISGFNSKWLFDKPTEQFVIKEDKLISIAYLNSDISTTPLYHTMITISTKKFNSVKKQIIVFSIFASLIFILLSSGAIIIVAQRFLGRRINDSLEILKDVEKGNLEARISISQLDEIGHLQSGINSMITKVGKLLSQYKQSIHEVESSKRLMREIIDTVPARIFWKDKDNRYLGANKLFLQDAGLTKEEEIIGKTDFDMVWKENAEAFITDDNKVITSGVPKLLFEELLPLGDGTIKYLLTSKVPLIDDSDRIYGMVGVFNDITEQKITQEEMRKQNVLLLEQSKLASMGEMIGNIAHQWRQPLSIISTSATGMILQKQLGSLKDEQFERTCNMINDNAQYLSKTIDDFRNFIKGDRKFVRFKLKDTLYNFINLVDSSFKRHNIQLILNLKEDIEVESYPNELIQCLMNIFNNAKDALKDAPHHNKYIFIDTFIQEHNVIIKLRDNAGGIPKDVLPRIFEPYFTTKHQSQGTGLGLSMTYTLVTEGMKGTLKAENINYNYEGEYYYGAEFTITLPLSK